MRSRTPRAVAKARITSRCADDKGASGGWPGWTTSRLEPSSARFEDDAGFGSRTSRLGGRRSGGGVPLLERGHFDGFRVKVVGVVCVALEMSLPFSPRWRGPDLGRMLDREHATLVDQTVARLKSEGWPTLVEYTFSVFGERGSVDVIGWRDDFAARLIAEVKSAIVDQQDLFSSTDRRRRLVPPLLAHERGWRALHVGLLLVMPDRTANRDALARHAASFEAAFPARSRQIRRWLREPGSTIAGALFVRNMPAPHAKCGSGGPHRVRRPRPTVERAQLSVRSEAPPWPGSHQGSRARLPRR